MGCREEHGFSREDLKLRTLKSSLSGKWQGTSLGGDVTRAGSSRARMLGDLGQGAMDTPICSALSRWGTARVSK